jgi:hypothetical protein
MPGLLTLFQDMSSEHPPDRISALCARDRIRGLRARTSSETLDQHHKEGLRLDLTYPAIPTTNESSALVKVSEDSRLYDE